MNSEVLNPQRQVKAKELARIYRRVMVFELALGFAYILAWLNFGGSTSIKDALLSITANDWLLVIGLTQCATRKCKWGRRIKGQPHR